MTGHELDALEAVLIDLRTDIAHALHHITPYDGSQANRLKYTLSRLACDLADLGQPGAVAHQTPETRLDATFARA